MGPKMSGAVRTGAGAQASGMAAAVRPALAAVVLAGTLGLAAALPVAFAQAGAMAETAEAAETDAADASAAAGLTANSHEGTVPVTAPAATVNGEELPVSVLVSFADATRAGIGSQTDAAWEAFLADQGFTVDEYWNYLIAHYATEMVLTQRCDELDVAVSDAEIDERVAQIRALLGISAGAAGDASAAAGTDAGPGAEADADAIWDAYVQLYGSEEKLRADIAYNLRLIKLYELEVPRAQERADEQVMQAYADLYAATYEAYGLTLVYGEDGAVDLDALDDEARSRIEADAAEFAWSVACDAYVRDLLARADIEILVEHQYDVEGQSHGVAAA